MCVNGSSRQNEEIYSGAKTNENEKEAGGRGRDKEGSTRTRGSR